MKKDGVFVFSLCHPFFQIFSQSDPESKVVRSYFKTGKIESIDAWPDGSRHKSVIYERKVSDIYNSLVEAGFSVERIVEPPTSFKDFKLNKKRRFLWYPEKLLKIVGSTIIFKAKK